MSKKKETKLETLTRLSSFLIALDREEDLNIVLDRTIAELEAVEQDEGY